jgi:hypothetical protein
MVILYIYSTCWCMKSMFYECQHWPSQESVVRSLEIGGLKLYCLCAEFFLSPKGYSKGDLADRGRCCTRDYGMEGSPTGAQQGLG